MFLSDIITHNPRENTDHKNTPIVSGIASSWKVLALPNLSANVPPVKDPTVAPARSVLTTHPAEGIRWKQ